MSIFSDYTTKLNMAFDRKLSAEARTFATLECIFQPISFITFFVAAVFAISRYFGYSMPSKIAYCFPVLLAAAVGYLTNWKTSIRTKGSPLIIEKLDIEGRIKTAVDAMDAKEFHGMVNDVAAQHLGAIQVLGYLLGALAGALLLLVRF